MNSELFRTRTLTGTPSLVAVTISAMMIALGGASLAQDAGAQAEKPAQNHSQSDHDMLGRIGHWFDEQLATMKSHMQGAKESFDRDADRVAKEATEAAKGAADAVVRLPEQRTVTGREQCPVAPNGAPDCGAAATALCRAKGFGSGKSVDSTTAEICPPRVMLSGRQTGSAECRMETFISRALCVP